MRCNPSRYFMYSPYLYPLFTEPIIPYFLVLKVMPPVKLSILITAMVVSLHPVICCHFDS
jgi:hypothetical protein